MSWLQNGKFGLIDEDRASIMEHVTQGGYLAFKDQVPKLVETDQNH